MEVLNDWFEMLLETAAEEVRDRREVGWAVVEGRGRGRLGEGGIWMVEVGG